MTMKRGGWGLRCGVRARLAAEESLPGIVSFDRGVAGINERIITESGTESCAVRALVMGGTQGQESKNIFTFMA